MEIHGKDVEIQCPPDPDGIFNVVKRFWPEAVRELDGMYLFVYKDAAAADEWNSHGWAAANDLTLISAILGEKTAWLTIDDKGTNQPIVDAIRAEMCP